MVTRFERSGILFNPQVYSEFEIERDGEVEEFVVQDLPQERIDEAAKFMLEYYVKDETFQKATKVSEKALKDFYNFIFRQKVSLACFEKKSGILVGLNVLNVRSKGNDTRFKSDDQSFNEMRQIFAYINSFYDIFDHYNVNYMLYAHGMAVKTEYRGLGIATELLKARIALMKAIDITVTASIFTTIQSQKAAEKVGFREIFAISYSKIQEKYPKFDFSGADAEASKLMALKLES